MSAVLSYVLDHWKAFGAAALVAWGVTATTVAVQKWKAEIAAQAVANERLADLEDATARADSLHKLRARTDSQVAVAQAHITSMRHKADSLARIAEREAQAASTRLAEAGDSLTATLDSLYAVVPPELEPLALTARRQHREEQRAQNELANALDNQLASYVDMLAAADSTSQLWRTRHEALEEAYEARGRACEACREALEVATPDEGASWGERLLWTGAGAGLGALVITFTR